MTTSCNGRFPANCHVLAVAYYGMLKIFGTEVVQKGTEVDLVLLVVPKVTSKFEITSSGMPKWICTKMDSLPCSGLEL